MREGTPHYKRDTPHRNHFQRHFVPDHSFLVLHLSVAIYHQHTDSLLFLTLFQRLKTQMCNAHRKRPTFLNNMIFLRRDTIFPQRSTPPIRSN